MSHPLRVVKLDRVALRATALAMFFVCVVASSAPSLASAFEPWWVQTLVDTELWSGPDDKAIPFGPVAVGTNLMVIAPQQGSSANPLFRSWSTTIFNTGQWLTPC